MTPEAALQSLAPWIKRHTRVAYLPQPCEHDTAPDCSKFSGQPLLNFNEPWPRCKCCEEPLELFLQLNLAQLPDDLCTAFGSGILQLFYCVSDNPCEPGWEPFSNKCSLCRIVAAADCRPATETFNRFPTKGIREWMPIADCPNPAEHESLGIEIDYHFNDVPYRPAELTCREFGVHVVGMSAIEKLESSITSADCDKLGGWPNWIQGVEYPSCPECGATMRFVMQLDSEDNVPYMFGDTGMGYITQCPHHNHVVAFSWACC